MTYILKKLDGGIFLISLGIILLLNVTDYVSWNIWLFYLNFWPVLIIIAGIKLIFTINKHFEFLGILIGIVLELTIIFGGLLYYKFNGNIFNNYSESKSYIYNSEQENTENSIYSFDLNLSYGDFTINTLSDNIINHALSITGEHSINLSDPVITVTNQSSPDLTLISFKQENTTALFVPLFNSINNFNINLGVKNIDGLIIRLGAGNFNSNISNLIINNAFFDIGAGEGLINIGKGSKIEHLVSNIGAGKMTLNIPLNYAYNISYSIGAGSVKIENIEIGGLGTKATNVKSTNFLTAEKTILINVSVGAGEFILNYVP